MSADSWSSIILPPISRTMRMPIPDICICPVAAGDIQNFVPHATTTTVVHDIVCLRLLRFDTVITPATVVAIGATPIVELLREIVGSFQCSSSYIFMLRFWNCWFEPQVV